MKSGLQIKDILFTEDEVIESRGDITLETLNEFHGDYDLDWILVKRNGVEVARHNAKYIVSIRWMKEV